MILIYLIHLVTSLSIYIISYLIRFFVLCICLLGDLTYYPSTYKAYVQAVVSYERSIPAILVIYIGRLKIYFERQALVKGEGASLTLKALVLATIRIFRLWITLR
jgi:hypothetical protein